ncbi:hypothetical protein L103DPR2_01609 [Limnohabitans sp. 103DPR2]|nr:hypothetical protein L103DPR2_01609 [Limnohabitans sp. 103DPR2]
MFEILGLKLHTTLLLIVMKQIHDEVILWCFSLWPQQIFLQFKYPMSSRPYPK